MARRFSFGAWLAWAAAAWLVPSATAAELVATLALDGLSFVSFQDQEVYSIPSGGTIKFHFASLDREGSIPVSVGPADVAVGPLTIRGGEGSMLFELVGPAIGSVRLGPDGDLILELGAKVRVTLTHPEQGGSKEIGVHFSTETKEAVSFDGEEKITVSGMRADPAARGIQLVGTSTNAANDYPGPGAAVYVVLSGAFDQLPALK